MNKNEFIEKIDKEILPTIREQLLEVYGLGHEEGLNDTSLQQYFVSHGIPDAAIIDLGLPSGTIWINSMKSMCYTDAQKLGLQFPTYEQIDELKKIRRSDDGGLSMLGLNGKRFYIQMHNRVAYFTESEIDKDFEFFANYLTANGNWNCTHVYAGESVYFWFVLPNGIKI